MMVIENPTVVRNADGSINIEESHVIIQDQRGGTSKGFLEEEVDGKTVHFNSARWLKMTFKELYEKNYIPVTIAELIGEKQYDKATVTVEDSECKNLDDVKSAVITSNYPIAVIRMTVTDSDNETFVLDRVLVHSASTDGPAKSYDMADWETLQGLENGCYKRLKIDVVVSTGEQFPIANIKP